MLGSRGPHGWRIYLDCGGVVDDHEPIMGDLTPIPRVPTTNWFTRAIDVVSNALMNWGRR